MIATINLKISTWKWDFLVSELENINEVSCERKHLPTFPMNLWVVVQSRFIYWNKFNCQSSRVSNPAPFISWYQPYQVDKLNMATSMPIKHLYTRPKFLLLTKRHFRTKNKMALGSTSHQVKKNCGITLRHQWLTLHWIPDW